MGRAGVAWRVGLAHLALAFLLQVENAVHLTAVTHGAGGAGGGMFQLLGELPFLQLQNLSVAAVLALVAWLTAGWRWLRPLPHLLLAFVNALLIGDQLSYKVFLVHIELTPGDAPWSSLLALRSSAWAAVGVESAVNLVVLVALGVWAWRGKAAPPAWCGAWRQWLSARGVAVVGWVVAVALVSLSIEAGRLQDHPVWNLLAGLRPPAGVDAAAAEAAAGPLVALADLTLPRSPAPAPPEGEDERLRQALARLRGIARPNVLLVVLESVGAKQLFAYGHFALGLMPHLAERAASGVAFEALYAPFPGTTRSHVALETGGGDIAGGDFASEIRAKVAAPTAARAFAGLGYRTAVFSAGDLGPQELGELFEHEGYGLLFDPQKQPAAWRRHHEVSSWGVDERVVCDRLAAWLAQDAGRPWFAQLLTVSTHHPYAAPGVPARLGDLKRYQGTLAFTDQALDGLLQAIERRGELARTIVVVTGDHGEAFATWHALNLTHRNYLYEENVRSFLLILSPALAGAGGAGGGAGDVGGGGGGGGRGGRGGAGGGVVSARVATMGDVLPTVLAALGRGAAGMPGQSLWPDSYSPRIAFFSKSTEPAQWGLRDGRFKFIAHVEGDKRLELYDLDQDPDEQSNVAAAHLDRAMLYDRLCARWFASASADYKARLAPGKDR